MGYTIPAPRAGTITMTKSQALKIQAEHIAHYSAVYGPHVADLVAAATTADALADGEHDVVTVNRHIPRGGRIEALIAQAGLSRRSAGG